MTDNTERCLNSSPAGCAADNCDELLAASSFGSTQARAIRAHTSAAVRAHAQQMLDREKLPPAERDIDKAVNGSPNRPQPSFWEALRPAQREQFRSRAEMRIFAAGARLMREEATANHVVMILQGETEVRVDDRGTERVLARRGPGQLLGERAALQVNVRSATVVAIDIVRALVMQTEDFAAFLSAHPEVLDIVESQVYFRLAEEAPNPADDDGTLRALGAAADDEPAADFIRTHAGPFSGENCTVILTDVVGFGSRDRTDDDRSLIRRELVSMTHAALKTIWNECFWEDRGDGLLVVAPPTEPTCRVLEHLLNTLPSALKRHNRTYAASARLQLRVALDVGAVVSDDTGVSGQVIINTNRLLDAPALKKAMRSSGTALGAVVSDFVYQDTVRQAGYANPEAWTKTRVRVKQTSMRGWICENAATLQRAPQELVCA